MNVAAYVRVSTEQQKEEGSHEDQRDQLVEWAERNNHDIEVFEDIAISGQADDRPAFEELMSRAPEFDAVAVREFSRFGRSLRQVLNDIKRLDDSDTEFISLKDNFDTSTAQGKLLMNVVGAFNQFWADLARERAIENVERRRANGDPIGAPKKLDAAQRAKVREYHDTGIGYAAIARLAELEFGVEVSRSTIRRYCLEEEA